MNSSTYVLDVNQIQKFLPHRFPFLLVDRILDIYFPGQPLTSGFSAPLGTRVVGLKNVSFNESYFQGHFPSFAIMPGVLMIECMAQVASFSVYPIMSHDLEKLVKNFRCILVGVDGARFRKPVIPGDTLRIETEVIKSRGHLLAYRCQALVEGKIVAEADLMANFIDQSKDSVHAQTIK